MKLSPTYDRPVINRSTLPRFVYKSTVYRLYNRSTQFIGHSAIKLDDFKIYIKTGFLIRVKK